MSRTVDNWPGVLTGSVAFLAAWLVRETLEARLVTHLLVQFPLLLAAGALVAGPPCGPTRWNRGGATGLALAAAISAFWMLPRSIDASLADLRFEAAKLASLSIAGAALARSLPRVPWLARQLLAAQTLAMAAAMGWLYTALPERLCLRYLRSEQDELGTALLLLAVSAFLLWLGRLCAGGPADGAARRRIVQLPARGAA